MKTMVYIVLAASATLCACSSGDDSSTAAQNGRRGGSAPSAATVVVSKGNVMGSYVDDINKAKALQRQSVDQSHPDLDKQLEPAPAPATAGNGP
ncbi:MAG TPA: hypothetical protein VGT99_11780 [Gammaproteobacteria bacterium]|nr:hypothetical protein [Gammaproteobacteria bacterium]